MNIIICGAGKVGFSISKQLSAPSLYCAVIIKQVDEKTRSKTSVNDLLRD